MLGQESERQAQVLGGLRKAVIGIWIVRFFRHLYRVFPVFKFLGSRCTNHRPGFKRQFGTLQIVLADLLCPQPSEDHLVPAVLLMGDDPISPVEYRLAPEEDFGLRTGLACRLCRCGCVEVHCSNTFRRFGSTLARAPHESAVTAGDARRRTRAVTADRAACGDVCPAIPMPRQREGAC